MIKDDVRNRHLCNYPNEESILERFVADFDITWGLRYNRFNTDVSIYFLKSKKHIAQTFGFDQEIILALSDYPSLQARTLQAIDYVFQEIPARGRVDQTVALIVSKADDVEAWLENYTAQNPQSRVYVSVSEKDLMSGRDGWFIRNRLLRQLFSRDLFDYSLPLDSDLFFFGRASIVQEHIDAMRRCENRGIFGLRKTGKTSVLFKIKRNSDSAGVKAIYLDCKLPSLYRMTSDELLDRVSLLIEEDFGFKLGNWRNQKTAVDRFLRLVENLPDDLRFCLIFDEIEYISPNNQLAPHWTDHYVPFWQAIWSVQSQYRKFAFIVAGVNATITETDRIGSVQNPVFGIVRAKYLTGFEKPELFSLLSVLGKRMGMIFDDEAVNFLFNRYGGHPLLTRMICSQINNEIRSSGVERPVKINKKTVEKSMEAREDEISFYCDHIVSELKEFYPDEYSMIEMLATGNIADFNDFSLDPSMVRHLRAYGLVDMAETFQPRMKIPVLQRFIANRWRRENGQDWVRYLPAINRRADFIEARLTSIMRDIRLADSRFSLSGSPTLYSNHGPSEADKVRALCPVADESQFVAFLNQMNRSFVEPIGKNAPKGMRQNDYFFLAIRQHYPRLWDGLNRIRAYRNKFLHLELNEIALKEYERYLDMDLESREPSSLPDGFLRLQVAVVDSLLIGIQSELARYEQAS
jgi:hypothetical protein